MTTVAPRSTAREPGSLRKSGVVRDLVAGLTVTLALACATWWLLGLPASYMLIAATVYLVMAALILFRVPDDLPGPGLGAANRVTLARAALAVPVAALSFMPAGLGTIGYWCIIVVSTVVMVLDGVDGRVARSTNTETTLGARFDMELDAALILALSVLVWTSGKVGAWALLIGLMRYLFVAASWLWPALRSDLPESYRRKAVCVVQGVVLLVALGPIISDMVATLVVGGGLAALTYSFAVDVRWTLANASS